MQDVKKMPRDPMYLIIKNGDYGESYNNPDLFILDGKTGSLIPRDGETVLNKFTGSVELLQYPDYFQMVSSEKYKWTILITSERIVCFNRLDSMPGVYEFMDHVDLRNNLIALSPEGELKVDSIFRLVGNRDPSIRDYYIGFQIAYTRISGVSVVKVDGPKDTARPGGIEMWYKDSDEFNDSDSQIIIYPSDLNVEKPYEIGLLINKNALEEKLRCTEKKKEIDPNFSKGDYNTWKSVLIRLLKKPDMLAQGSGSLDSSSWDPLIFQSHPIQWQTDAFARSLKPNDKVHLSM